MDDAALELVHVGPLRGIALGMAIIALAHPEEIRGEGHGLAAVDPDRFDGPQIGRARPARPLDPVPVADVPSEIVLGDDLAHVGFDFLRGRDRRPDPWLEAVAEGVEIAVGTDARIFVGEPGAAETLLALQDDKALVRKLLCKLIGAADAGNAGADDQDVEMFSRLRGRCSTDGGHDVHCWFLPVFLSIFAGSGWTQFVSMATRRRAEQNDIDQPVRKFIAPRPIAARSAISSHGRASAALRRSIRRNPKHRSGPSTS